MFPRKWEHTKPSFEEWCKVLGYDPNDEAYWEQYGEWSAESYPMEDN